MQLTQVDYLSTAILLNQLDMQLIKPNEIRNHHPHIHLLPLLVLLLHPHHLFTLALTTIDFICFILVNLLEIYSLDFITRSTLYLIYSKVSYHLHQLYLSLSY